MADDPETPHTDDEDSPLLAEIESRYQDARDHASKWRNDAREDFRFYAGDQWTLEDISKMEDEQRPGMRVNRVRRLINAVIGHEANNRAEVRYIPLTIGDAQVNELLTNAGKYFRDQCDAEHEESDGFRDTIICGMGWAQSRLSDAENPDYDLIEERVDPLEMLWDPSSKKPNLADGRYVFRRKRYTEKEIKTIWPDFKGDIADAFGDDSDDAAEPVDRAPRSAYRDTNAGRDVRPDVLVLEYQYKQREAFYVLTSPKSGESIDMPASKMSDEMREKLSANGISMVLKRKTIARRCFVIGRTIVQGPDEVCPKDFTYHCITGFRDREKGHWFGIVKMLKDPQRWSNKWLAQMMHILNSNAKGGVMLEEDSTLDRHEFEKSWADPAAITWVPQGTLEKGRLQPKPPPLYPQGVDKLLQYGNESFTDVSGVNQELLGLADREQAGVLEWQRKQSAVTLLAPLFDSLRRFRKMQGRVWLYMMQRYVSDGRLIRITVDGQEMGVPFGGEQQSPDPRWRMPDTAEYDVIVDQAPSAPNQKEQTWSVLTQLFPVLKDALTPDVMLLAMEYSPLPPSFVEKLRDLKQQQEAKGTPPDPEMMKAQAQIQMKQQELQIRQQEAQLQLAVEQQKAQMQLETERQKMALEVQKAEMQMGIERQKSEHAMALQQQQMAFDASLQAGKAQQDAEMQERQAARDDEAFQQQTARDDAAADAKLKREDRAARAKAKRQPRQDGATA